MIMKAKNNITDCTEAILLEIEKLKQSKYVKLAKKNQNKQLKQKLYQLRSLEKKGKAIAKALEAEEYYG